MASIIKFDNSNHWYTKDGEPKHDADLRVARKLGLYRSVTSIDKDVFPNHFLQQWKMNELAGACANNPRMPHESIEDYANRAYQLSLEKASTAAEFGKGLHDCMDGYPQMPLLPDYLPWYLEFVKWYDGNIIQTIASETVVLDHDIGVAGRLDRIVVHKTLGRCIIDYKTQNVKTDDKDRKKPAFYDAWGRQLGFYAVCDAKERHQFPSIPQCLSLVLDSNTPSPPYEKVWEPAEIIELYKHFVAGAWLYHSQKKFWPTGSKWEISDIPMPI